MKLDNLFVMFVFIAVFVNKVLSTFIYGSYSNTVYQKIVYNGADRIQSAPLTDKDCITPGTIAYNLKSCELFREDPYLLQVKASKYLQSAYHQWTPKVYDYHTLSWNSQTTHYRKRRDSEEKILSRKKRAIPGNPCVGHESVKTVVLFAVDSETREVVELLQDPYTGLYQTFFTYPCTTSLIQFLCEPQNVEFLTAVFTGNNYNIEVRQVEIPTHCAVSIHW